MNTAKADELYTLKSLPSEMIHLGGENFAIVNFFLGHSRVHIRKYVTNEDGYLQPTKDGVSISPRVWWNFQRKLTSFTSAHSILVVDKDLFMSCERRDDETYYTFQRMFQRKNQQMQFVPECVCLTENQFHKLQEHFERINQKLQERLIRNTLQHYLTLEEKKHAAAEYEDFMHSEAFNHSEFDTALRKCLTYFISVTIDRLLYCFGCEAKYTSRGMHDCFTTSRADKWTQYFTEAFFNLDWNEIAADLFSKNKVTIAYIDLYDYFSSVDIREMMEIVEKMYIQP